MEWLANGELLYNTGNFTQHSVIIYIRKESEKERMWLHEQLNHFFIQQKLSQHCKSAICPWNFKKWEKKESQENKDDDGSRWDGSSEKWSDSGYIWKKGFLSLLVNQMKVRKDRSQGWYQSLCLLPGQEKWKEAKLEGKNDNEEAPLWYKEKWWEAE